MKKLTWDSSLEIGNHDIDNQHRALFDLANLIFAAAETQGGDDAFEDAFEALCDYTDKHFREEEDYLESIGSPFYALQRKQHAILYEECRELRTYPAAHARSHTARALRQWMTGRLLDHFQLADRLALATAGTATTSPAAPARTRKRAAAG